MIRAASCSFRRTMIHAKMQEMEAQFKEWYDLTVDLPGAYYLQVVSWLFKQNRLATGNFVALGRRIDLSALRHPIFLLGAARRRNRRPRPAVRDRESCRHAKQHIETATDRAGI